MLQLGKVKQSMMGTKCILFLLLCSSVWSLVLSVAPGDKNRAKVLQNMIKKFKSIRHKHQFGGLYIPPPTALEGQVMFVPRFEFQSSRSNNNVIFPKVTSSNRFNYESNYVAATVDFNGAQYAEILNRPSGRTIHTEDLCFNLVFPGMEIWYNARFRQDIRTVYLYSYFLPCRRCFEIIQHFVRNRGVSLYVGYTQLLGGVREGDNEHMQLVTQHRRDEMQNFLNNNRGRLLQVVEDGGICPQTGIESMIGKRGKRDTSDINICEATEKLLVIAMDFTSGKAQVWFNNSNPDYYGWVELLDQNNNRLTWEWTWSEKSGQITFNTCMQNGAYVKYWPDYDMAIRKSYPWNDCGFGFVELIELPYTDYPYSYSKIKLTMKDAYPTVLIKKSPDYTPNSWDWVMIQTLDQIGTEKYQTWQWVSSFTKESYYFYYQFSFGWKYAEGFRAKYVFYDGTKYRHKGTYDNASPIWTPGGCQGGA